MNVWREVKYYIPDFLYIKLPRDLIIRMIKELIASLEDSEIPSYLKDPEFHGNYYTLKLARIDKIYPIIYGKGIDLEEVAKYPQNSPEVLKITRSLYNFIKGKSLEEIIEENGWNNEVKIFFEEAKKDLKRYSEISKELEKRGINFDNLIAAYRRKGKAGVRRYLKRIFSEEGDKFHHKIRNKLKSWYLVWLRVENLKNFEYSEELFKQTYDVVIKILESIGIDWKDAIKLYSILNKEGRRKRLPRRVWHPSIIPLGWISNKVHNCDSLFAGFLKEYEKITGKELFLDDVTIFFPEGSSVDKKYLVINKKNIDYLWHILGYLYLKGDMLKSKHRDLPTIVLKSHLKSTIEHFKKYLSLFNIDAKEYVRTRCFLYKGDYHCYNIYALPIPMVLSCILKEFLRNCNNEDHAKKFLSEVIRITYTRTPQYYIKINSRKIILCEELDRLLELCGISYNKYISNKKKYVRYTIHSNSKPLVGEIYNMSIFKDWR